MILTGMLFLIGLSSDVLERKMILYFSGLPFIFFTVSSLFILSNKPLKISLNLTKISLIVLFLFIGLVSLDIILFQNTISKSLEENMNKIYHYLIN